MWQNYTIDTGNENVSNLGKILLWNGKPTLNLYDDKYADLINGTDGT